MASSSAEEPHNHRHESNPYATTAAPPPTPSIHTNVDSSISTSEALSVLLHRLPPTLSLSLPSRPPPPHHPPLLSLSDPNPILHTNLLSASTKLGFFHLKHQATYPATDSLFKLPNHKKQLLFPNNWPLGYDEDDDDHGESFCLDFSSFTNKIDDLDLDSLREFTREMETLGLKLIRELASVIGFENPTPKELCSLLWIADNGTSKPGRVYPYVIGLHYVPSCQKSSLCSDSGWVNVSGQEDYALITLGDIAQVWSNGRLKKVRGRPMPCSDDGHEDSRYVTMSLLITLPVESMVFPQPAPKVAINTDVDEESGDDVKDSNTTEPEVFHSFPFEDYAWRVYHERLLLKDPLLRYRI
ncbi:uncharacterized protein LOC142534217 [Primulina tabacum]|uniref:uncharacterized protein LOC142534217 n=1 Tax=Primulina tabacum TaxID=48773 RepID=UPI003F593AD2